MIVASVMLLCAACQYAPEKTRDEGSSLQYATQFDIQNFQGYDLITMDNPWKGSTRGYQYALVSDTSVQLPDSLSEAVRVSVPCKAFASNSTTHLPMIELLGQEDRLTGFAQTQFISSELFNQKVSDGSLKEIGHKSQLNLEIILELDPEVFLAYNTSVDNGQLSLLERNNITVFYIADYMERSVLGRAEWIKALGLLTGEYKQSVKCFDQLELRYDSLLALDKGEVLPTVMSGSLYGGSWFAPGGDNYNAQMILDAGGQYVYSDDEEMGWLNLDFEQVYNDCWNADYWIGAANFNSLDEMKELDERYANFKAFKEKRVYTYAARVNEAGANDYFESGQMNPDRLLADHIKILHPEVMPDYELYYYKKLD